jgi:hypothetical protein
MILTANLERHQHVEITNGQPLQNLKYKCRIHASKYFHIKYELFIM